MLAPWLHGVSTTAGTTFLGFECCLCSLNMAGGTATAGTAMAVPPFRVFFWFVLCVYMCVYAI